MHDLAEVHVYGSLQKMGIIWWERFSFDNVLPFLIPQTNMAELPNVTVYCALKSLWNIRGDFGA